MATIYATSPTVPAGTAVVAVPVGADLDIASSLRRLPGEHTRLVQEAEQADTSGFLASTGFRGQVGETQSMLLAGQHIVAVGITPEPGRQAPGMEREAEPGRDELRRAGAALARATTRARSLATNLHTVGKDIASSAQAVVEGMVLASYRYRTTPEAKQPLLERVALVGHEGASAAGAKRGRIMAEATLVARRWADMPAGELGPRALAAAFAEAGSAAGLEVEIWDEQRIADEGLGCLASVAAGSAEPPRLVRLTYEPAAAAGHLAMVGKGITFDSGGLSLKPPEAMETMKGDMSGAAAVMAAVTALPELGPPAKVDAWAAIAENMPGGHATRPGDVVVARDGTSVEIVNTDAEGRLVLADALLVSGERGPDAIIDVATLTGGQGIALGRELAAVFGTDEIVERVLDAAARAGEPAWRLPLWPGYRARLDSEVADLRNVAGDRLASSIMGALFLQRFVKGIPWAHLDIAAPSYSERDEGCLSKGHTGWGARTALELITSWTMAQ
jgi:leucyl aminopeptidase